MLVDLIELRVRDVSAERWIRKNIVHRIGFQRHTFTGAVVDDDCASATMKHVERVDECFGLTPYAFENVLLNWQSADIEHAALRASKNEVALPLFENDTSHER